MLLLLCLVEWVTACLTAKRQAARRLNTKITFVVNLFFSVLAGPSLFHTRTRSSRCPSNLGRIHFFKTIFEPFP